MKKGVVCDHVFYACMNKFTQMDFHINSEKNMQWFLKHIMFWDTSGLKDISLSVSRAVLGNIPSENILED